MDATSAVINAVWGISVVAESAAVANLVRRGLWTRYPLLTGVLALEVLRSLIRAHALAVGGGTAYRAVWLSTQPFAVALLGVLVLEGYLLQARELGRRFTLFGAVAIVVFTVISGCFVWATASIAVIPGSASSASTLLTRYYESWYLIATALYRLFFRSILRPGSRNIRTHGRNLLLFFAGSAVGAILVQWRIYHITAIGQLFYLGTSIFVFVSWARFRMEGEEPGFGPPRLTEEELRRQPSVWRELLDRIRGRRPVVLV